MRMKGICFLLSSVRRLVPVRQERQRTIVLRLVALVRGPVRSHPVACHLGVQLLPDAASLRHHVAEQLLHPYDRAARTPGAPFYVQVALRASYRMELRSSPALLEIANRCPLPRWQIAHACEDGKPAQNTAKSGRTKLSDWLGSDARTTSRGMSSERRLLLLQGQLRQTLAPVHRKSSLLTNEARPKQLCAILTPRQLRHDICFVYTHYNYAAFARIHDIHA